MVCLPIWKASVGRFVRVPLTQVSFLHSAIRQDEKHCIALFGRLDLRDVEAKDERLLPRSLLSELEPGRGPHKLSNGWRPFELDGQIKFARPNTTCLVHDTHIYFMRLIDDSAMQENGRS